MVNNIVSQVDTAKESAIENAMHDLGIQPLHNTNLGSSS